MAHDEARHDAAARELEQRIPGRAQIIAAVHAYADFLAEHPEIPAPSTVTGTFHQHEPREDAGRVAYVERYADAQEIELDRGDTSMWARLPIAVKVLHGVEITHVVQTHHGRTPL
jgi:hypothetical protein